MSDRLSSIIPADSPIRDWYGRATKTRLRKRLWLVALVVSWWLTVISIPVWAVARYKEVKIRWLQAWIVTVIAAVVAGVCLVQGFHAPSDYLWALLAPWTRELPALLVVVIVSATVYAVTGWKWSKGAGEVTAVRDKKNGIEREDRFAQRADVIAEIVLRPGERFHSERLTLGYAKLKRAPGEVQVTKTKKRWVAPPTDKHVAVFGPTGSGKTSSFLIPQVLSDVEGNMIIASGKPDILAHTVEYRRKLGEVTLYDLSGLAARYGESCLWSPLDSSITFWGAHRTANAFVESRPEGNDPKAEFWNQNAKQMLACALFAAAQSDKSMADVMNWVSLGVTGGGEKHIQAHLEAANKEDGAEQALNAWRTFLEGREEYRRDVLQTLATKLFAFAEKRVLEMAETSSDFRMGRPVLDPAEFVRGKRNTHYLISEPHDKGRFGPVIATQISDIIEAQVTMKASLPEGEEPTPLWIFIDEAATSVLLPNLDDLTATARGDGIRLCLVFQNKSQLDAAIGPERTNTVLNNCSVTMFLTGCKDSSTLSWLDHIAGSYAEEARTLSEQHGDDSRVSITRAQRDARVAPASYVRQLKSDEALIVYGNLPITKVELVRWFEDPELRRRAGATSEDEGEQMAFDLDTEPAVTFVEAEVSSTPPPRMPDPEPVPTPVPAKALPPPASQLVRETLVPDPPKPIPQPVAVPAPDKPLPPVFDLSWWENGSYTPPQRPMTHGELRAALHAADFDQALVHRDLERNAGKKRRLRRSS